MAKSSSRATPRRAAAASIFAAIARLFRFTTAFSAIVARDVVLEDIRQQVAAGAAHITFGDPDFFNGVGHALPLIEALHRGISGAHLRRDYQNRASAEHREHLATLRDTGCLFVTSAVESIDDAILDRWQRIIRAPIFSRRRGASAKLGLTAPADVCAVYALDDARKFLRASRFSSRARPRRKCRADPAGDSPADSRGLAPSGFGPTSGLVGPFDDSALAYPWNHADPRVDALCINFREL